MHTQRKEGNIHKILTNTKVFFSVCIAIVLFTFFTATNNDFEKTLIFLKDTALFSFGVVGMWITLLFPTILGFSGYHKESLQEKKKEELAVEIAVRLYKSLGLCIWLIAILLFHHILSLNWSFCKYFMFSYIPFEYHCITTLIFMRIYASCIVCLLLFQFYIFLTVLSPFSDTLNMIRRHKTELDR